MKHLTKTSLRASALLPLLALIPPLAAQTAPQATAPASDNSEIVNLPAFSVSADRTDPYRPTQVLSVARVAGSIDDQAMTVNVVTSDLLSDLGANSSYDVSRYFAGISNGRGAGSGGISDRQDFRGFESFSKTIDNFSSFLLPGSNGFQANFDPAFIDRAEFVMGPDTILAPTGTPGGSENILTKEPQFDRQTTISTEVGNYNAGKTVIDTTGPVSPGGNLAYRVIADYQDAEEYVPGSLRMANILGALTYRFSDTAKLDVKYIGEQWETTGDIANANDDGEIVYQPNMVGGATLSSAPQAGFTYDGWAGGATWSHRDDRVQILESTLTAGLTDHISTRFGVEAISDNMTQDAGYTSANPKDVYNETTGQVTGITASGYTLNSNGTLASLSEIGHFNHTISKEIQLQNDYAGNFQLGPISIDPVAGWAYQQGHQPTSVTAQTAGGVLPNATDLVNGYSAPHPAYSTYTIAAKGDVPGTGVQEQAYALTRVSVLDDRIIASAGVSRTWADINNYASTGTFSGTSVPGGTPYTDTVLDSQQDTYIAGLLGKITKNISAYYSFTTNAAPTIGNFNTPLWQTGKQDEFGIKTSWFNDRLSVSVDHFYITEQNLTTTNPAHNVDPTQPTFAISDVSNPGYELNVVGGITQNLSIIASATEMKYRDQYDRRVRNVPDQLASLLLNYHFRSWGLDNLNVFGGVVHEGSTAGESAGNDGNNTAGLTSTGMPTQVGFYLPSWTVFNAGVGYTLTAFKAAPIHFGLNVDNVFNQKYWWEAAGRNSVSPYPGATVRLTTSITF